MQDYTGKVEKGNKTETKFQAISSTLAVSMARVEKSMMALETKLQPILSTIPSDPREETLKAIGDCDMMVLLNTIDASLMVYIQKLNELCERSCV